MKGCDTPIPKRKKPAVKLVSLKLFFSKMVPGLGVIQLFIKLNFIINIIPAGCQDPRIDTYFCF